MEESKVYHEEMRDRILEFLDHAAEAGAEYNEDFEDVYEYMENLPVYRSSRLLEALEKVDDMLDTCTCDDCLSIVKQIIKEALDVKE